MFKSKFYVDGVNAPFVTHLLRDFIGHKLVPPEVSIRCLLLGIGGSESLCQIHFETEHEAMCEQLNIN